jgi:hypothetical protein
VNGYRDPLTYGGDLRGESPAAGRALPSGYATDARNGLTQAPTELRAQANRLIEAGDPESSLKAAAFYLQEGDQVFAQAAHQFSVAERMIGLVAGERAQLAADRGRIDYALIEMERERQALQTRTRELEQTINSLAQRNAALDARETALMERREAQEMEIAARRESAEMTLMERQTALDNREALLRVRESDLCAQKESFESEQKKVRRQTSPAPMLPDSGPQHLRPNPRVARTEREFMACLTAFKDWMGNRSLRTIAESSGGRISPSTVSNILKSTAMPPRWDVVDAFVQGCGGNEDDRNAFVSAWRRLHMGSGSTTIVDL